VTGVLVAFAAGAGVYLLYTAVVLRRGAPLSGRASSAGLRLSDWLTQAGLNEIGLAQFCAVSASFGALGALVAFVVFGGALPSAVSCLFCAALPVAGYRARRARRMEQARQAWPHLIEEIRLQTGNLGRSVPQALFEVGRRGPAELRASFEAAEREWVLSTDFARTVRLLKAQLADPTADAVLETLLVAHEVGGTELDRRLAALVEDRTQELDGRRDAIAKQAGARFARRFVLLVPLGMALAGLSIGDGRAAYETPAGQVAVAAAIGAVVLCWVWAGRLMALPEEERVFR